MARASTPTLLSLDRYAKIMGINPAHFNGAAGGTIMPVGNACSDVWWQYDWQANDMISRESLADAIAGAEEDIANWLGFWPAPVWIAREMRMQERHHRRYKFGTGWNGRGDRKSVILEWGKLIGAGRRYTQLQGSATVLGGTLVFSDGDGDGYAETATITIPNANSLTSASLPQIKAYFDGYSTPEWEIRPHRSIAITGGNIVITFWAWQLIDPDLWEALTTDQGRSTIDLAGAVYVSEVDIYREYTDYTQHSVEFFWEPRVTGLVCTACSGTGCTACQMTVQCGCLHVRNVDMGIAVPTPGDWNATTGVWDEASYTLCYEPDMIKVWYYAGDLSDQYLRGLDEDPLSLHYAQAIAWMATARLERPFCSCGNVHALAVDLRRDLILSGRDSTYFLSDRERENPFGTRKGEVMAWRRLSKIKRGRRAKVAVG